MTICTVSLLEPRHVGYKVITAAEPECGSINVPHALALGEHHLCHGPVRARAAIVGAGARGADVFPAANVPSTACPSRPQCSRNSSKDGSTRFCRRRHARTASRHVGGAADGVQRDLVFLSITAAKTFFARSGTISRCLSTSARPQMRGSCAGHAGLRRAYRARRHLTGRRLRRPV